LSISITLACSSHCNSYEDAQRVKELLKVLKNERIIKTGIDGSGEMKQFYFTLQSLATDGWRQSSKFARVHKA